MLVNYSANKSWHCYLARLDIIVLVASVEDQHEQLQPIYSYAKDVHNESRQLPLQIMSKYGLLKIEDALVNNFW